MEIATRTNGTHDESAFQQAGIMQAGNHLWVRSDRRNEADLLSEIAAAESNTVILSEVDPSQLMEDARFHTWSESTTPQVLLCECGSQSIPPWELTSTWPLELTLLVVPPNAWQAILFCKNDKLFAGSAPLKSLQDQLLKFHTDRVQILRTRVSTEPRDSGEQTLARHSLIIPGTRNISALVRAGIDECVNRSRHPTEAIALRAGLFQWSYLLEESHSCAQAIEGQGRYRNGDYWHAILHRREPDSGNAKYWFRRVGAHPIFKELGKYVEPWLAAAVPEWKPLLMKSGWDPYAFVDFCEAASTNSVPALVTLAERIQEVEMLLLLEHTERDSRR